MGVYGALSTPSPEGAGVGHKMASVTKWRRSQNEKGKKQGPAANDASSRIFGHILI